MLRARALRQPLFEDVQVDLACSQQPWMHAVIPDFLNSSKYIACFYFKDTLLIPFDDTPDQNLEINLAGMRLRIICLGHCYRQLTVRQKSHRARITRVILLPISPRVGCVVLSLFWQGQFNCVKCTYNNTVLCACDRSMCFLSSVSAYDPAENLWR